MRACANRFVAACVLVAVAAWASPAGYAQGKRKAEAKRSKFAPAASAIAWAPEDVDATVPQADTSAPCALDDLLKSAAERSRETVANLPQFTATETMEHYEQTPAGDWGKPKRVVFNYLVEMKQIRPGMLVTEETRDGRASLERFPDHLATLGLPAVALVFHPYYVDEYAMQCEGLASWQGRPAWQIHFQQRPDKFPRLRGYRVRERSWALKLKGRAWIDSTTFQVLHIETDLMEPIPQIPLLREHLSVDYRPVKFRKQNEELWLQQTAKIYMDSRGHHYRRKHTFSDFLLFSVGVDQTVTAPVEPSNNH